jgi:hypothetical protein
MKANVNNIIIIVIVIVIIIIIEQIRLRAQWSRGLRHEMSSLSRTLGSWVRIPLEALVSAFIMRVVLVAALRRADSPFMQSH